MKDTNKHSFEEEFKKVFEEAEATPSPVLWAEIDAHLANQEAASYKRRLLYYKISAAAAVVLLVSFIGLWSLNNDFSGGNTAVLTQTNDLGTSAPQPENTNGAQKASTDESSSRENSALAGNGFKENPTGSGTTGNTSSSVIAEKDQPGLQTRNAPETIALQSPVENTTAVPRHTPGNDSRQPDKRNLRPGRAPQQGTLAENTPVPSLKESSGRPGADVPSQEKNLSPDSGKESVPPTLEVTTDALAKDQPGTKNGNSGSNNISTNELPASTLATNETISDANSRVSNSSLSENPMLNAERNLYSILPLNRTIAVAGDIFSLQAPAVQTQTSPYPFWLEEEAQEEKKQKKTAASKWSVALAFTPSQFDPNMRVSSAPVATANAKQAFSAYNSATNLSTGQTANSASPVSRDLQNAENFGLSYNVGMNVQYALNEKLSLQSGLQYMHNNSQIVTDNYLEDFSNRERYPVFLNMLGTNHPAAAFINENAALLDQTSVPGVPNSAGMNVHGNLKNTYPGVTQVLVQNLYQYISVPLRLQYKLIDRKLSTSLGAGVAADVFLKNTVGNAEANVPEVEFNRQNNNIYKTIGVSALLNARLNYEFGGRYSVYVEPSYRTALTSFTKSDEVKSLPNSFGVGTGLQYRF